VTPRALSALIFTLAIPPAAGAQTTDPIFARWSWAPPDLGGRPSGLGGAFVGLADGSHATYANPAGLGLIPLSEVSLHSGGPWLAAGRRLRVGTIGGYAARPQDTAVDLTGLGGGPPARGGSLRGSVREAGFSLAAHPFPRIWVGATAALSRLEFEGQRLDFGDRGMSTPAAFVEGEDTRVRMTAGMLITLLGRRGRALPMLRFGLAYQPGVDWSVRAGSPSASRDIDVRRPSLVSVGLAWRANGRWSFTTQGDFIRFSQVVDTLSRNAGASAAAGFSLPDTLEPRLGAEYGAPLWCGCGIVRLRGGIHYRSPGTLRYSGPDSATAEAFTNRPWRTEVAFGGSFYTEHFNNALRLDFDARDVFEGRELSFGVAWRF
jgi:hypothetical protein